MLNVKIENGLYYEQRKKDGEWLSRQSVDYVWRKTHWLSWWLKQRTAKPFAFVEGDARFYASQWGWDALKDLNDYAKYYCKLHGEVMDTRHPALIPHEGFNVVVRRQGGRVSEGVVHYMPYETIIYHKLIKEGNTGGAWVSAWDIIDEVSRV